MLAVFLLWMGSLHTISSVDTTSNGSKKPDHIQTRGNKLGVRRVERSVPLYDLTLTSDDDDGADSTNRNRAVEATTAVRPAMNQQAVRVRRVFGSRRTRCLRRERRRQNNGTSPRRGQNQTRGSERGGESTIARHGTSTATKGKVISLLTSDEESVNESNNADVSDNSRKEADPPIQKETPNEQGHREQNQVNPAREVTPEMQEKETKEEELSRIKHV